MSDAAEPVPCEEIPQRIAECGGQIDTRPRADAVNRHGSEDHDAETEEHGQEMNPHAGVRGPSRPGHAAGACCPNGIEHAASAPALPVRPEPISSAPNAKDRQAGRPFQTFDERSARNVFGSGWNEWRAVPRAAPP